MDAVPQSGEEVADALSRSQRSGQTGPALYAPPVETTRRGAGRPTGIPDELLQAAYSRSPSGMTVWSIDGRCVWANQAFCRLLGYQYDALLATSYRTITHHEDVGIDREFVVAAGDGASEVVQREKRYERADGAIVWAWVRTEVIRDAAGDPLYFVSHVQDITERRRAQDRLADSERTLRSVIDNTPAMISVKGRDHRYKLVNREFAQAFGSSSSRIVGHSDADILPPSTIADVRAKDLAVFNSGKVTQEEQTIVADGQLRLLMVTRFPLLDEDGEIDGVCMTSVDITERRLAERAKHERMESSELIYSALTEDRFVLYGQPITPLSLAKPAMAELLIRMRDTSGGVRLVAPGAFLPAAERFGLIPVIDRWVVARAIELARAGHRVGVNVSATTASDPGEVDRIEAAVVVSGAAAANLIFEITETAVAYDIDAATRFAKRLHNLGCAIALDDFGVGHGSFTYLRHLPIDYLKIDMQFVSELLNDHEDQQVVEAIVGVARQFGIETIAEGVESLATLERLRELNVDYAQGHVLGRPVPLSQCWQLIDSYGDADAQPD